MWLHCVEKLKPKPYLGGHPVNVVVGYLWTPWHQSKKYLTIPDFNHRNF